MTHSDGLSDQNARFWDEPCGLHLASTLGIKEFNKDSLAQFDAHYFGYYDYLEALIMPHAKSGISALEIGLGFGSVGQGLAEAGCAYTGMDIAATPVEIMNARLGLHGLPGQAIQGDFLSSNFDDKSFDLVVSIGCLHHTGDLKRSIDKVHAVLASGGVGVVMVYNRFSYRQILGAPVKTLRDAFRNALCPAPSLRYATVAHAERYDADEDGNAAPFTELASMKQLRFLFRDFADVTIERHNCADERFFSRTFLRKDLRPVLAPLFGLDLYITAKK